MTTKWQNIYGPIVAPNNSANVIVTAPANVYTVGSNFINANGLSRFTFECYPNVCTSMFSVMVK